MKEENRKLVCKVWFLAICLLPTVIQLWSIFGAKVGKRLANVQHSKKKESASTADSGSKRVGVQPITRREKTSIEKWAVEQGISESAVEVAGSTIVVRKSDLPKQHPLNILPFQMAKVSESDSELSWRINQLVLDRSSLEDFLQAFVARKFQTVWRSEKQNFLRIEQLIIQRVGGGAADSADGPADLQMHGVEISIQDPAFDRIQIAGRLVTGLREQQQSIEIPFGCQIARDGQSSILELTGRSFPIWFLNQSFVPSLGANAEFSGKIKQIRIPQKNLMTEFSGTVAHVNCGQFSKVLSPSGNQFLSGECYLKDFTARLDGNQIVSLAGEFQSVSTGSVSAEIASVLGSSVKWVSNQPIQPFRSFLLIAKYEKGQLLIQSKYPGGQLIWSENGTDILVSNRPR